MNIKQHFDIKNEFGPTLHKVNRQSMTSFAIIQFINLFERNEEKKNETTQINNGKKGVFSESNVHHEKEICYLFSNF